MADGVDVPMRGRSTRPYPPSWVDRLIGRITALPGPSWLPYLIVFVAVLVFAHAAAWLDGFATVGTIDPFVTSIAFFLVWGYAAIHYLDGAAARAWDTFRPAVTLGEEEAETIVYRLTTMPPRATLAWTAAGLAMALIYGASQYGAPLDLADEPLTLVGTAVLGLLAFAGMFVLIYHSIHQLRQIARLHGFLDHVELLNLEPLHAFSGVTAVTGGLLLLGVYVNALTDPATFTNPALIVLMALLIVLAIVCFAAPLYGIHTRIAAEKLSRQTDVNQRIDRALRAIDRRADAGDLNDAEAVHTQLTSLLLQRDLLARVLTWPWSTETFRSFGTAIILPIGLWLLTRVLERALG